MKKKWIVYAMLCVCGILGFTAATQMTTPNEDPNVPEVPPPPQLSIKVEYDYPKTFVFLKSDKEIFSSTLHMIKVEDERKGNAQFYKNKITDMECMLTLNYDSPMNFKVIVDRRIGMYSLLAPANQNYVFNVTTATPEQKKPKGAESVTPSGTIIVKSIGVEQQWRSNSNPFYFNLDFNLPIDPKKLQKNITIVPEIKDMKLEAKAGYYGNYGITINGGIKPATFYQITIKAGELGFYNEKLEKDVTLSLISRENVDDECWSLAKGKIAPYGRAINIPVKYSGTKPLQIQVKRVIPRNLHAYIMEANSDAVTEVVLDTEFKTIDCNDFNAVEGELPLNHFMKEIQPGIYKLKLYPKNESYDGFEKEIVVSNVGMHLTQYNNQISMVFLKFNDNTPLGGTKVQCYDKTFKLLSEHTANTEGVAQFQVEPKMMYIIATHGNDVNFMKYEGLKADPEAENVYFATVAPERYNARPGEKVAVFANIRSDKNREAAGNVTAKITLASAIEEFEKTVDVTSDVNGFAATEFEIPLAAGNGYYTISVTDPFGKKTWGSEQLYVSNYVPDRVEISQITTPKETPETFAKEHNIKGKARYYFGAPCNGFSYAISRTIRDNAFPSKIFSDYSFGYNSKGQKKEVRANGLLDSAGGFDVAFEGIDYTPYQYLPLKIEFDVSITEAGGRTVSETYISNIYNDSGYLGVKYDTTAQCIKWVYVSPDDKEITLTKTFRMDVIKKNRKSKYVFRNGTYQHENYIEDEIVDSFIVAPGTYKDGIPYKLQPYENYIFQCYFGDQICCQRNENIWESNEISSSPDKLIVVADKKQYAPGDVAQLQFTSTRKGTAYIYTEATMGNPQKHAVNVGQNTVSVKIPENLNRAYYQAKVCVVTEIGPHFYEPIFLEGLAKLDVNAQAKRLKVALELPPTVNPKTEVKTKIRLTDMKGNPVQGTVQVWGVDEGVVAFSNKNYSPFKDIYENIRKATWNQLNNYCYLLNYVNLNKSIIGGGDDEGAPPPPPPGGFRNKRAGVGTCGCFGKKGRTQSLEYLAKTSRFVCKPVQTNAQGEAECTFVVPQLMGNLKVFAIAFDKVRTGSCANDLIVRDPLVVMPSLPLSVNVNDSFKLVFTVSDEKASYLNEKIEIVVPEGVRKIGDILSDSDYTKVYAQWMTADRISEEYKIQINLTRTYPEGNSYSAKETISMAVRSQLPIVTGQIVREIKPGATAKLRGTAKDFEMSTLFSDTYRVETIPVSEVIGAIEWLKNYPHGCVEQTTSAAFPLLCTPQLIKLKVFPESFKSEMTRRIQAAHTHLQSMISYYEILTWPGSSNYTFEDRAYIIHFLVECKLAKINPPEKIYKKAFEQLVYRYDAKTSLTRQAYSLYVGARAGDKRVVPYLMEISLKELNPAAEFFVGAALMRIDHVKRGSEMVRHALSRNAWYDENRYAYIADPNAQTGMMLWILSDLMPNEPALSKMAIELKKGLKNTRSWWGTTHANAMSTMGLIAYLSTQNFGQTEYKIDAQTETLSNTGKSPVYIIDKGFGIPQKVENQSKGLKVIRTYRDVKGNTTRTFKQGELVKVHIEIQTNQEIKDLAITDMLPGCFEIEDANLATRRNNFDMKKESNVSSKFQLQGMKNGDDRCVIFGRAWGEKSYVEYTVRVISEGKFAIPVIDAESMYNPDLHATQTTSDILYVEK